VPGVHRNRPDRTAIAAPWAAGRAEWSVRLRFARPRRGSRWRKTSTRSCSRSACKDVGAAVERSFASGVRSGVNGTPTCFINDVRHDGPWDVEALLEALALAGKT
jgi:hypothetical protein